MKKFLTFIVFAALCLSCMAQSNTENKVHSEVMAWSNITGVRLGGELIDFESALCVGVLGGKMEKTGRERQQNVRYRRQGSTQIVDIPLHGAHFHQEVTDVNDRQVRIKLNAEADETLAEGAFFSMAFAPKYYANAKVKTSGKKVSVTTKERSLTLMFDKKVSATVKQEQVGRVLYVTLMPALKKGEKADLEALLTVDGTRHNETAHIGLDLTKPGSRFTGFGGNFRIQNSTKDPAVIDYCLKNMRVAMGRVEFPWASWDKGGKTDPHVVESARMAARLKAMGMPVVVSCWFPPQWALVPGQERRRGGVAALRLDPAKQDSIYESMVSYLLFLKADYGVEADYFSFNESDIGIDVLHTPQEHCDFIKTFGATLARHHLPTKMLLGDNSDATTLDFLRPALEDKEAHRYIGAVSFHSWRGCDDGPLRPTQRFHNLRQLAMTPVDAFAIPLTVDKENVNTAAFYNKAQGRGALHIVNNGAACKAEIAGLPASVIQAVAYVTNASQCAEEKRVEVAQGKATLDLPAESFVTLLF